MEKHRYETDRMLAWFDDLTHFTHVVYRGVLIPETTVSFYDWVAEIDAAEGVKTIRGCILDFRQVVEFDFRNLLVAKHESQSANAHIDMSHIPVALIVANMYQDQMVHTSMMITPQQDRKRIVKSDKEALAFIDGWNRAKDAQLALESKKSNPSSNTGQ